MDVPMEKKIVKREMVGEVLAGDGRTLDLRIVPYNDPQEVRDRPGGEPYMEEWLPGVFDKQVRAADKVDVLMNFEHEQGIRGVIGRGQTLRDSTDGAEGSFRMLSGSDSDKALELVNDGVARGVSLEAIPLQSRITADGVVQRVKARLLAVALCRSPALVGSEVLAVRQTPAELDADDRADDRALLEIEEREKARTDPPDALKRNSEVDELLARVGYEPLLERAVVRTAWDGSASQYDDVQWARACILDRGEQFDTPKTRFALPVLEPNGDLNVNGMHAAASRLNQVQSSSAAKAAAARKLARMYRQAGEQPPAPMMALAGRG